ncbi:hypothetical protein [Bacteroides faecalis]|uniref:Immunity protein 30 domain-containing protein n=1 Tax=Bacteroides faecalis TaxID=2447885 RepID=A0A401LP34_9BACE|nr:hypothetical protein [Bacteroides faecalis]GCB33264.1 hypothetical protein KGMB02408_02090 [Bacteroides faecalis]
MDEYKKDYLFKDQIIKKEISELINQVKYSSNSSLKYYSRILLTDYYKTTDVENLFFELLHDKQWENQKGNLIFSLNECIEPTDKNSEYLDFFIHLLLNCEIGDEVYMDSVSIIMDLRAPFKTRTLNKNITKLEVLLKEKKLENEKKKLALFLLDYLKSQKEITAIYKKMSKKLLFY